MVRQSRNGICDANLAGSNWSARFPSAPFRSSHFGRIAVCLEQEKEAQEAITDYQGLATVEMPYPVGKHQTARYSLVELFPQTGRKHQLRRHLKHLFHPIMGDTKYGDLHQNRALGEHSGVNRLMLHSHFLHFIHPKTSQKITIKAPLDEQWKMLFQFFDWNFPDF